MENCKKFTDDNITKLNVNEIFVFGSNEEGEHGKGAALTAMQKFGAKKGKGIGLVGRSYGIPMCSCKFENGRKKVRPISLIKIKVYVDDFIEFAINNPDLTFLVTKIGCGLAYYKISDIAPFFKFAVDNEIDNIVLPKEFFEYITK